MIKVEGVYELVCPHCGKSELVIRPQDLDSEGGFVDDPIVGCVECEMMMRSSSLVLKESYGKVVHLLGSPS